MFLIIDNYVWQQYRPKFKKCGSGVMFIVATVCFVVLCALAIFTEMRAKKIFVVYVYGTTPKFVTNERFLSIALDSSTIANGFPHFQFNNSKLIKTMAALSPAYLRIGGSMADKLIFIRSNMTSVKYLVKGMTDGGECAYERTFCNHAIGPTFTMTGTEWLKLNELAHKTKLDIIFGLNAMHRFDNGSWNPSNAKKLISFSSKHNLPLNWELGNEPNSYPHQFNYTVAPLQMAKDFHTLRSLLHQFPKYMNSLLLGPDVTRPEVTHNESILYLKQFLDGGSDVIDAVTWHHYYFNGATASINDFINPTNFDLLKWQISTVNNLVPLKKKTWLGETSSAYGGGAPHLSNRFVATFLWLDKLGLAAKHGLDVVIRQTIFHGNYALLSNNYTPSPDWWISIFYKKLVSNKVVNCHVYASSVVRLYCHCTPPGRYFQGVRSVTVFGVNISNHKARIRFQGLTSNTIEVMENLKINAYILNTLGRIDSRFIYLNDILLALTRNHTIPDLQPQVVDADPYVVLPAYSLAFWVVPLANSVLPFC